MASPPSPKQNHLLAALPAADYARLLPDHGWRKHAQPGGGAKRRLRLPAQGEHFEKGIRAWRTVATLGAAFHAGADYADGADRGVQPAPYGGTAMDRDAGVWGSGGPEALRASEIPPWAAIDNKTDSTQNPMVFSAPLFTSPLRPDMTSALAVSHRSLRQLSSRQLRRSVRDRTEPTSFLA